MTKTITNVILDTKKNHIVNHSDFINNLLTNLRTWSKKTEFLTPGTKITSTLSWIAVRIFSSSNLESAVEPIGIFGMCTVFSDPNNSPRFITQ